MPRPPEILCVGVVVVDAVGILVDEIPDEGSMLVFDRVELHIGGCAANTSMALAKMGIRTGLIASVVNDGLGDFAKATLKKLGVDIRGVKTYKNIRESTPFSFVMVPSSGNRRILHTVGSSKIFSSRDIAPQFLKGVKWVTFEGLTLMTKFLGKDLAKAMKAAHKAGARTAADTALNNRLSDWPTHFSDCWEHLDVFFPSEEEAKRITGDCSPREICRYFYDRGVKIAGVKLGERGCALQTADGYEEIPAFPVKCIDTLGAGDCFMAGLLTGLLEGRSPYEAARMGNATAAFCVQAVGATTGIPQLSKIKALMKSQSYRRSEHGQPTTRAARATRLKSNSDI